MYFPIGDIHGRYDLVAKLYDEILYEIENGVDPAFGGTIVFLGDYIDRGPDSKKVVDFMMQLEDTDNIRHIFLKGNHEEMMTYCRERTDDDQMLDVWLRHGGIETLDAFGVDLEDLYFGALDDYIAWMNNLPVIAQDPDYVFVHAGVHKDIPLNVQPRDHCMWDFNPYEKLYRELNKIVIHGHMMKKGGPYPYVDIKNKRIWMDVGANFRGKLCTVTLPEPFNPEDEIRVIEVQA